MTDPGERRSEGGPWIQAFLFAFVLLIPFRLAVRFTSFDVSLLVHALVLVGLTLAVRLVLATRR